MKNGPVFNPSNPDFDFAFDETLRDMLKGVEFYDPRFKLSKKLKQSKVYDPQGRKQWQFEIKSQYTKCKHFITGQRSIIPVYPGGFRDSCVLDIESLNSVQLSEALWIQVLTTLKESLYTEKSRDQIGNIRMFIEKTGWYYMRDLSKCGLKFPRHLLCRCQKILREFLP